MIRPKIIISLCAGIFFYACATAYGPRNSMGGYEEKNVGEDMIEVRFYGNQHTTRDKTAKQLLYRCAELTQESGFDSFVILQDQSYANEIINNPTLDKPFKTVESESVGVRTVISPDLTSATTSKNWVGVYIISMFNAGNSNYDGYKKSHLNPQKILKDYKKYIK